MNLRQHTLEVPVISVMQPWNRMIVKVTGASNWHQVVREALIFALKEAGMKAPMVTVTEHEMAVKLWQDAIKQFCPSVPSTINGNDVPFWRQRRPGDAVCYYSAADMKDMN